VHSGTVKDKCSIVVLYRVRFLERRRVRLLNLRKDLSYQLIDKKEKKRIKCLKNIGSDLVGQDLNTTGLL
jgi:hypothetical protein